MKAQRYKVPTSNLKSPFKALECMFAAILVPFWWNSRSFQVPIWSQIAPYHRHSVRLYFGKAGGSDLTSANCPCRPCATPTTTDKSLATGLTVNCPDQKVPICRGYWF